MYVRRRVRWFPRSCTGHLVVGVAIFPKWGTMEEELDQQYLSPLSIFPSTYKSPKFCFLGPIPITYNEVSLSCLYIPPSSPYTLVIHWISSSLCRCGLMFCFVFSFCLFSLAFPVSSFIPYPSFSYVTLLLSLPCRAVHSWSWKHTMSQSCQLVSTAPLRTCQRWMGWW